MILTLSDTEFHLLMACFRHTLASEQVTQRSEAKDFADQVLPLLNKLREFQRDVVCSAPGPCTIDLVCYPK